MGLLDASGLTSWDVPGVLLSNSGGKDCLL